MYKDAGLNSSHGNLLRPALLALGATKRPEIIPILKNLIVPQNGKNADPYDATEALVEANPQMAISFFRQLLQNPQKYSDLRGTIYAALGTSKQYLGEVSTILVGEYNQVTDPELKSEL